MIGTLNHHQIAAFLSGQLVGRIGFRMGTKVSVIPIAFAYEDGFIYAHSKDGEKVKAMRKYPQVCFQVDSIDNLANWRSVLVWGDFEEVTRTAERQRAMALINDKISPFTNSETTMILAQPMAPRVVEKPLRTVVYRIRIREVSGRFEKYERANGNPR